MTLRLVTAPTALAVSLSEAKDHLGITETCYDAYIVAMIKAATQGLSWLNRTIVQTTYDLQLEAFEDAIYLPKPPATAVSSVKYLDESNVEQTLSTSVYEFVSDVDGYGYVRLKYDQEWPSTLGQGECITIRYTAGYSSVPDAIKYAILLRVGSLYALRKSASGSGIIRSETTEGQGSITYDTSYASTSSVDRTESALLDCYRVWEK